MRLVMASSEEVLKKMHDIQGELSGLTEKQ